MAFQSQSRDVPQVMLSVLFLALMIIACLWIVQPFILGFARAGTVVIATAGASARTARAVWSPLTGCHRDDIIINSAVYSSGRATG